VASESTSDLRPSLTRLNAIALVAGTIIGASIFVQPSEIAQHLSRPAEILLVWLACGVLTLFGTGGLYIFLRETFSPFAGFLWGWAMFWIIHAGIIAIIAMVFARYTAYFVPVGDTGVRAIAVLVILGLSALNYVGVRAGSQVQTVLTGAKVIAIGAIVVVGFALIAAGSLSPVVGSDLLRGGTSGAPMTDFLLAMVAGLFAYGGWHMVTYTAGETVMPARVIPIALIVGVAMRSTFSISRSCHSTP
jgi:APA family basic amino acid/polyamine antiporter